MRQNGRQWLYVLMAVCAATGAASALIMPELNTAVVNLFLEQFSRELPAGVHAVLIWDGAGYHTGRDLVVPGNVSLIQLPPYSPELNPVENLWHYLRSHHWSNREYEGYKGLQEEAIRSLRAVCQDAEKLKTICNADYVNRRATSTPVGRAPGDEKAWIHAKCIVVDRPRVTIHRQSVRSSSGEGEQSERLGYGPPR